MKSLTLALLCSLACTKRVLIGQTFTPEKAAPIQVDKSSFNSYDDYIKKVAVVDAKDVEASFRNQRTQYKQQSQPSKQAEPPKHTMTEHQKILL